MQLFLKGVYTVLFIPGMTKVKYTKLSLSLYSPVVQSPSQYYWEQHITLNTGVTTPVPPQFYLFE